jgi:putative transposase
VSLEDIYKSAMNNPPHLFRQDALYMITGSIYQKKPLVRQERRKAEWLRTFLQASTMYHWQVIAWVVLDNHYHAIVESPENPLTLSKFVGSYHKYLARLWNIDDNQPGRKVWWNYWDRCIRSEIDYKNRLRCLLEPG